MESKKSLPKALIFSLLICLAGAVVWGLIYSFGYISYVIAFITVMFAGLVYAKCNKKFGFLAFLWVVLWAIIFNEIAIIVATLIELIQEYSLTFNESLNILLELITTNQEVKNAFIQDTLFNVVFVLLGGIIVVISNAIQKRKLKNIENIEAVTTTKNNTPQQTVAENSNYVTPTETSNNEVQVNKTETQTSSFTNYYNKMKEDFRKIVVEYKETKNQGVFKEKALNLKAKYIDNLKKQESLDKIRAEAEKELNMPISSIDKATLNTILKFL